MRDPARTCRLAIVTAFVAATLSWSILPTSAAETSRLEPVSGVEATPFALDDLAGHRRQLQDFSGKVVLLHFFATWCVPCVDEMTSLQALTRRMHGKPVTVVAVNVAEVDLRVRSFFEKLPVDFPVLLDRDRKVTRAWEVVGLPSTYVLDTNHSPRLFVEGDLDWSHPDIVKQIEALFPAGTRTVPHAGG